MLCAACLLASFPARACTCRVDSLPRHCRIWKEVNQLSRLTEMLLACFCSAPHHHQGQQGDQPRHAGRHLRSRQHPRRGYRRHDCRELPAVPAGRLRWGGGGICHFWRSGRSRGCRSHQGEGGRCLGTLISCMSLYNLGLVRPILDSSWPPLFGSQRMSQLWHSLLQGQLPRQGKDLGCWQTLLDHQRAVLWLLELPTGCNS